MHWMEKKRNKFIIVRVFLNSAPCHFFHFSTFFFLLEMDSDNAQILYQDIIVCTC